MASTWSRLTIEGIVERAALKCSAMAPPMMSLEVQRDGAPYDDFIEAADEGFIAPWRTSILVGLKH